MGGMSDICIRCKINVHAKLSTQFKRSSSPMWWRLYVRRWGSLVGGWGWWWWWIWWWWWWIWWWWQRLGRMSGDMWRCHVRGYNPDHMSRLRGDNIAHSLGWLLWASRELFTRAGFAQRLISRRIERQWYTNDYTMYITSNCFWPPQAILRLKSSDPKYEAKSAHGRCGGWDIEVVYLALVTRADAQGLKNWHEGKNLSKI